MTNTKTLLNIIHNIDPTIDISKCRFHSAISDSRDPLKLFLNDQFKDWQEFQTKRNFGKKDKLAENIISVVKLPQKHRWLFAGVYKILGEPTNNTTNRYKEYGIRYTTRKVEEFEGLAGKVVVIYEKKGPCFSPFYTTIDSRVTVAKMLEDRYK